MVDSERIAATGEIDPIQSAAPHWRLRLLGKRWLAAVILGVLAIGHGRFEYVRWAAEERARHEAHAKRLADADNAKASAEATAAKRGADEETIRTIRLETEALKAAAAATPPGLDPQPQPLPARSATLAAALMPAPLCEGTEAQAAGEQRCSERKDGFKDCSECPEMVVIPAGEVMMGSPSHEEGRAGNEGPQHRVTIEKRFAASKFETTFEEWNACLLAEACKHAPSDQGWGKGRHPVINVSWADAKEYVTWLSKKTGLRYRLLTEAEWEYAARAGTTTAFSTGAMITIDDANFDGGNTHVGVGTGQYRKSTVAVGSFRPNAFGLYDMHGNVWEWVEDCWHTDYSGGPGNGDAWTDRCNERTRVLRGGSWIDLPRILRSAYRSRNTPIYRGGSVGFRVARTLD